MKYYLAIVQNDSAQSLYSYDSLDAALSAFHSELAYRAETRTTTLCIIFNTYGTVIKNERWEKTVEDTEPQE